MQDSQRAMPFNLTYFMEICVFVLPYKMDLYAKSYNMRETMFENESVCVCVYVQSKEADVFENEKMAHRRKTIEKGKKAISHFAKKCVHHSFYIMMLSIRKLQIHT